MIRILIREERLLLKYTNDLNSDARWVDDKLKESGSVTLRRTFTFKPDNLVTGPDLESESEDVRTFALGVAEGDFYKIERAILGLKHDLLLSNRMPLSPQTFIANRDISIFRRIDDLVDEPIVVGGDYDASIPLAEFAELLRNFPTSTELTHYANARISRTLKDYLGTTSDAQKKMDDYLNRRRTITATPRIKFLQDYEPKKFEYIYEELNNMLLDFDSYTEHDWQKLIIGFLLLIFPKYIVVLKGLQVKDFYSNPTKVTNRYIDLTLVDANGTIDIIEIKKPFANCLLSSGKYRDNYTPKKELSGSVMQVEKYIFHLNKWGRDGEQTIRESRKHELPPGFELKITNPKAMIILGRDSDFADDQKFDFEIIKRKYANVIDIMTYDDLLRRLHNIILMIKRNYKKLAHSN